jgi:hypothetical protein
MLTPDSAHTLMQVNIPLPLAGKPLTSKACSESIG